MSQLSLDSLENETICKSRNKNASPKSKKYNLKGRISKLKPQSFYLEQKELKNFNSDTRPDETAFRISSDNRGILCTGAIIARDNIEKMPGRESTSCKEIFDTDSTTGRIPVQQKSRDKTVAEQKSSSRFRFRDSSTKRNLLSCCHSDEILEKNVTQMGVILPKTFNKPKSYLELYRQKYSAERKERIRSPEGSTPSICGDNLLERHLTDVESRGSSWTSGDDQSELGFYRQLMEQNLQEPQTARSCETFDCPNLENQPVEIGFHKDGDVSSSISDGKLRSSRRSISYQPYTIEDYKTLSVPRADRSLGPDQVEVEKKRVWLLRRRSYGDIANARNRQNIILRAQKHKDVIGEHKVNEARKNSNRRNDARHSTRPSRPRKASSIKMSTSRRSKSVLGSSSHCLSKTSSPILEDRNLESLRQRHLNEKRMIDQLINRSSFFA